MGWKTIVVTALVLMAATVPSEPSDGPERPDPVVVETVEGIASYYASSLAGNPTASGVPYDPASLIAAHRDYPFGTRLRVTNLANDRVVEVEVIDRGPYVDGRIVDLSRAAAERLEFLRAGLAEVRVEVLDPGA
jgi:rare lipoprotein A